MLLAHRPLRAVLGFIMLFGVGACSSTPDGGSTSSEAAPGGLGSPASSSVVSVSTTAPSAFAPSSTTAPSLATAPEGSGPASLDVPPNEIGVLQAASDQVVAACMRDQGFQYVPVDLATSVSQASAATANRRVDLPFDPSTEGLGYAPLEMPLAPATNNDVYAQSLPAAEQSAWAAAALGDLENSVEIVLPGGDRLRMPKDGCIAAGRVQVYGSLEVAGFFEAGLSSLRTGIRLRTLSSPEFNDAMQLWISCMQEQTGRRFDSFDQARNLAYGNPQESQSIANADASCTDSSALRDVYKAVHARATEAVINENLGTIEAFADQRQAAVARAEEIIGGV